jgi:multiple sugar transport system substrate-binding protein
VAEFTAGANPDALYVRDDYFAGWVTAGYLQDIEGMPGVDKVYQMIYDYNADAMTYQSKRYGLPYYADVSAFVYNEEMLQKAGIGAPPKSLKDLEEQGQKLKQAGIVQYPMALGFKQTNDFWVNWWALIYASGAKLFADDMTPIMHSENTVARDVLTWINRGMNESTIIDPASLELTGDQVRDAFMAGQYAYLLIARYDIERANNPQQSQVAGKVKMALVPSLDGENKGTVGWTRMYCLSKATEVKDAAYKLIHYLGGLDENGDPYTARFWFRERGLGFAYKKLADDPEIKSLLQKWVDPAVYGKQAETARARENIKEPWYSEWESGNQQLLQRALTAQLSVDEAMQGMADNAQKLKKQYS